MFIIWNEYTWYSKLLTLIIFLGLVPVLVFYIGMQYQQTINTVSASVSTPFSESKNGSDLCGQQSVNYERIFETEQKSEGLAITSFDIPLHHFSAALVTCLIKVGVNYEDHGGISTDRYIVDVSTKEYILKILD